MNHFLEFLSERKPEIDALISNYIRWVADNPNIPPPLKEGLIYAVEGEGKRLRPALTLLGWEACRDWFGNDSGKRHFHAFTSEVFRRSALAVELIHTYSLVHDDLPAMDDDSLRRGRPTCHVRFNEAIAILIGDALLNHSFEFILSQPIISDEMKQSMTHKEVGEVLVGFFRTARTLSVAAGSEGMIGGQVLDMEAEKKKVGLEGLKQIHENKTGKLIQASLNLLPAFYGDQKLIGSLGRYAQTIGLLYQVVDDILDVTRTPEQMGKSGTDIANEKTTFIKLMGLDDSRAYAENLNRKAKEALKGLENSSPKDGTGGLSANTLNCLIGFADFISERSS